MVYTPEINVSISTYRPLSLTLEKLINWFVKLDIDCLGKNTLSSAGLSNDENQKNSTTC